MEASDRNSASDELLRHAQWIRGLARALVKDEATAEDVVQETWVAALRHAPAESKLRPWLRSVVRNFARQHHRSSGRRSDHEAGAKEPGELPGPDELSERLEMEQRLTRELARLDEPFRSTLMHRYYDNLEPAEIARRLGEPGGTVRWRLKRGLEILRARLDDVHDGDRKTWCLALLPLARVEEAAAVGAGLASVAVPGWIVMNVLKVLCASAVVVVAAIGLAVTGVLPESIVPWALADEPVAVGFRQQADEQAAAPTEPELLAPELETERVAAAPAPLPEPEAAPAVVGMAIEARVYGHGRPIEGATMIVAVLGTERLEPEYSDLEGLVSAQVDLEPGDLPATIEFHAPGFASRSIETHIEPDVVTHMGRIELEPGGSVAGRVVDELGRPIAGCRITLGQSDLPRRELDHMRFVDQGSQVPYALTDERGEFILNGTPVGMQRLWARAEDYVAQYTPPIEVREGQESFGVEIALATLGPKNLVRGIVLSPDGAPVPKAPLRYRKTSPTSNTTYSGTESADEEGRFEFQLVEDARLWLTASDPEGRWGKASVADIGTGDLALELRLVKERTTELVVLDAANRAVGEYGFELYDATGDHRLADIESSPRGEGRAMLSVPTTEFIVRITAPGHALGEIGPFDPDQVGDTLEAYLDPLPGLRGVVLRDGLPVAGVRVALRQQVSETGTHIRNGFRMRMHGNAADSTRTDAEGTFLLTPRTRGSYFVRAEPDQGPPAEYGPFTVASDLSGPVIELHLTEGGAIEGRVMLAGGVDAEGAIVGLTRGDGGERTLRAGPGGHYRFDNLMPGPWRVELRDEELRPGHTVTSTNDSGGKRPFDPWTCTVAAGETTYYDLEEVPVEHYPFEGRFTIDGEPASGWIAMLVPSGTFSPGPDAPKTILDSNGRFTLQAEHTGQQRFILRGILEGSTEQFVVDEVRIGGNPWRHDLRTGTLLLERLEEWDQNGAPPVVHYWKGPGDLFCVTAVVPDENGAARVERVPAGRSKMVVPNLAELRPETWDVLSELTLEPGATQTLVMP